MRASKLKSLSMIKPSNLWCDNWSIFVASWRKLCKLAVSSVSLCCNVFQVPRSSSRYWWTFCFQLTISRYSRGHKRNEKLDNWLKTDFYLNFSVILYIARVYVGFSSVEKTIMNVLSVDRTSMGIKSIHSLLRIHCQPSLLAAKDVSRERRLRFDPKKFHADNVALSAIWSTSADWSK